MLPAQERPLGSRLRLPRDASIVFEPFHDSCTRKQLELRLQTNDARGEVFDSLLLRLQRLRLPRYLVLQLDHGGERTPHTIGDAHQTLLRALRLAAASIAAMRWLLAAMNSRALSIDALARSAAAFAASANAPSSS